MTFEIDFGAIGDKIGDQLIYIGDYEHNRAPLSAKSRYSSTS